MGLRPGLDWCGKSRLPPGFDPRTVQPIGSRYTDYATRPTVSENNSDKSLNTVPLVVSFVLFCFVVDYGFAQLFEVLR